MRTAIADQTAAFNRHEVDKTLFTEDANFVNAQGIWLKGAAELNAGGKPNFRVP